MTIEIVNVPDVINDPLYGNMFVHCALSLGRTLLERTSFDRPEEEPIKSNKEACLP
jgi:hypothetical protein